MARNNWTSGWDVDNIAKANELTTMADKYVKMPGLIGVNRANTLRDRAQALSTAPSESSATQLLRAKEKKSASVNKPAVTKPGKTTPILPNPIKKQTK